MFIPADEEAPRRIARLRELGLGERPEPEFDEFARRLAGIAGAPLAMVNFLREHEQYFAGLYAPGFVQGGPGTPALPDDPARFMRMEQGWCPHVVARRKPLILDDVCDYPRFAGNPVVDQFNIRAYMGAPLIDQTGTAIGTVCVVDTRRREWGDLAALAFIKAQASELLAIISQRAD